MLSVADNEVFLRMADNIEDQKGYQAGADGSPPSFRGNDQQYYFRYKRHLDNKISLGIVGEKDAGEAFFEDPNKRGFDYYAYHFYLRDYRHWLKTIVVGDFDLNMGQGLIHFDGFGSGKSSEVINVKKGGRMLTAHTSLSEVTGFRGFGSTFKFANWTATLFASRKNRDANLTTAGPPCILRMSLLPPLSRLRGLHRTNSEIEDKHALSQTAAGMILTRNFKSGDVSLNALYQQFDSPIFRSPQLYNKFVFSGKELLNVSLDYTYVFKNIHFYGETAVSDNRRFGHCEWFAGQPRSQIGCGTGSIDPMTRTIRPFSPTPLLKVLKEPMSGVCTSAWKPGLSGHLNGSAYYDVWKHPWFRFRVGCTIGRGENF